MLAILVTANHCTCCNITFLYFQIFSFMSWWGSIWGKWSQRWSGNSAQHQQDGAELQGEARYLPIDLRSNPHLILSVMTPNSWPIELDHGYEQLKWDSSVFWLGSAIETLGQTQNSLGGLHSSSGLGMPWSRRRSSKSIAGERDVLNTLLLLQNLTLDKRTDGCCDKAALIVWLGLGKKSCFGLPGSVATNTAGHCHDISLKISGFTWPPSRLAVT